MYITFLMLVKNNSLAGLQIPTGSAGRYAIPAIRLTCPSVIGNCAVSFPEADKCYRQIVRIGWQKAAPCAEDNDQVLRKISMSVEVFIDQLILFGKAEEAGVRELVSHPNHHLQIGGVGDIAGGMPAEIAGEICRADDAAFIFFGITEPERKVVL